VSSWDWLLDPVKTGGRKQPRWPPVPKRWGVLGDSIQPGAARNQIFRGGIHEETSAHSFRRLHQFAQASIIS
jgi:hypothetical protein